MRQLVRQRAASAAAKIEGLEKLVDETRLLTDVLLGDTKAIEDFLHRYNNALYCFISRMVDDPSSVEDLRQEVFLAAWLHLDRFQGKATVYTWLCAIAQKKVADYFRKQICELPIYEERDERNSSPLHAPTADVEHDLDRRIFEQRIRSTMLQLPEGYRAVLRWRYWDETSLQDIALKTGKTAKSIERLLARARAEFATKWERGCQ